MKRKRVHVGTLASHVKKRCMKSWCSKPSTMQSSEARKCLGTGPSAGGCSWRCIQPCVSAIDLYDGRREMRHKETTAPNCVKVMTTFSSTRGVPRTKRNPEFTTCVEARLYTTPLHPKRTRSSSNSVVVYHDEDLALCIHVAKASHLDWYMRPAHQAHNEKLDAALVNHSADGKTHLAHIITHERNDSNFHLGLTNCKRNDSTGTG